MAVHREKMKKSVAFAQSVILFLNSFNLIV